MRGSFPEGNINSQFADLVKESGGIIGCLAMTFGPIGSALAHMFQLLKNILAKVGLAILSC